MDYWFPTKLVEAKPNPWQGKHRLTKEDWFAASNSRNTLLCHARGSHIAYVDDLSVLMPGWFNAVKQAVAGNYICCGSYQKVSKLSVKDGKVIAWEDAKNSEGKPVGLDNRRNVQMPDLADCGGHWMYGCSVVIPINMLLAINGWPEDLCDGHGFEDVLTGLCLKNNGFPMKFDKRMMTLESEEHHHIEKSFRREDYGKSPNDKSHAALGIAQQSKSFPNTYNVAEMRQTILNGGEFPVRQIPDREWYTKKHLSEL